MIPLQEVGTNMLRLHTGSPKESIDFDTFLVEMIKPVTCTDYFKKKILEYTTIGVVSVVVGVNQDGEIVYCVNEPFVDDSELLRTVALIIEGVIAEGLKGLPSDHTELKRFAERYHIDYEFLKSNYTVMSYLIAKGLSGYGPLYPLLEDPNIEEISVNSPNTPAYIVHRSLPIGWIRTNILLDSELLDNLIIQLARRSGRDVSLAHPYLEALLPEGHRVAATFSNEISRFGSSLVIRKHRMEPLPITSLVAGNVISTLAAAYLWLLMEYRPAILIVGPTASGKTTFLQALLSLIPPYSRIVTIEDTPELNLPYDQWDSLVTRYTYSDYEGEDIDIYKLAKFALRRRPDYFVIGEIRGEEARVFIHAAGSGHAALATFHADSPESALQRLRSSPINLGDSFLQLLWLIVVLRRVRNANGIESRRVVEIVEVVPTGNTVEFVHIFKWDPRDDMLRPVDVDTLINSSYRLRLIAELYGLSVSDIRDKIETFASLLKSCISCDFKTMRAMVEDYYRSMVSRILESRAGRLSKL